MSLILLGGRIAGMFQHSLGLIGFVDVREVLPHFWDGFHAVKAVLA